MSGRTHPAHVYLGLKSSFRRMVRHLGGQEAAASLTRADHQRIGRYGRPHETMQSPIDVIVDLETEAGEPFVTRRLAEAQGYTIVRRPAIDRSGDLDARDLGGIAKETGEAVAALGQIIAGGAITPQVIQHMNLRREIREAIEALTAVDAGIAAILADDEADEREG